MSLISRPESQQHIVVGTEGGDAARDEDDEYTEVAITPSAKNERFRSFTKSQPAPYLLDGDLLQQLNRWSIMPAGRILAIVPIGHNQPKITAST